MITRARLRRGLRRETLGVDIAGALNLVGILLLYLSPAFLVPAVVAVGYGETPWPFVSAAAVTAAFGFALERLTTGAGRRQLVNEIRRLNEAIGL